MCWVEWGGPKVQGGKEWYRIVVMLIGDTWNAYTSWLYCGKLGMHGENGVGGGISSFDPCHT